GDDGDNSGDNSSLIPCPENWNPLAGHGPACRPTKRADDDVVAELDPSSAEEDDSSSNDNPNLVPCPKNWNPKFGRGPACRPAAGDSTEQSL
ncbi:hypothetical protein EDD21DRAFT_415903, partial [Dissophora ornata]